MTKELNAWEAALRLEIARATGQAPEVEVPEEPKKAKKKNKFLRHVVLGISNDRGHTVTEWGFDSKQLMESLAEIDARKAAKAEGLSVYSLISNKLIK